MFEYVKNLYATPYIAIGLYWLPMVASLIRGIYVISSKYVQDRIQYKKAVEKNKYFDSELTIGFIFWKMIVSIIPIVNIWVAVFSFLPGLVEKIFRTFGRFFSIKLVPSHEPTTRL